MAAAGEKPLEPRRIEVLIDDVEHVPACLGDEQLWRVATRSAWLEQLAELRDVALENGGRGLWRSSIPERIDEGLGGDDVVSLEHQKREQRRQAAPSDLHRAAIADDAQSAEDPE